MLKWNEFRKQGIQMKRSHLHGSGRGSRKNPLVLVFHTASRAYWNDIAQGIVAFAKTADWNLQVVEGEPDARASFDELVRFWRPDGCIFEDSIARYARSDIWELEGLPTVFINCERAKPNGLTCAITVNSQGIGELAAHELMSSGVPNFAFYGFSDFNWSSEREDGYRHALEMNGRTCGVFCRPFKSSDRTSRSRMVRWLSGLPKPCGVFAANDLLSSEVLNVCQETGQRVPDDICILGVDNDIGCCENTRPTLSSISPDFFGEGRSAGAALATLMSTGAHIGQSLVFDSPAVVRRQSTRRFRSCSRDIAVAVEYIRVNACRGISSRDVFPLFHCTRRRVEQRFRDEVGHSVLDEINAVRIAQVDYLLLRTDRTLESIAIECGFRSVPYMRTLFQRVMGESLGERRNGRRV